MINFRDESVSHDRQIGTVRAMRQLYRGYFDSVADSRGKRPAKGTNDFTDLDGAIYMIWDMDCIETAAMWEDDRYLVDPVFSVLETALECRSVACQISGLHALGHLHLSHCSRVQATIDRFLLRGKPRLPWVAAYAALARKGNVQ
jgi:hypothetical protein